jgi:hypothetical protein
MSLAYAVMRASCRLLEMMVAKEADTPSSAPSPALLDRGGLSATDSAAARTQ